MVRVFAFALTLAVLMWPSGKTSSDRAINTFHPTKNCRSVSWVWSGQTDVKLGIAIYFGTALWEPKHFPSFDFFYYPRFIAWFLRENALKFFIFFTMETFWLDGELPFYHFICFFSVITNIQRRVEPCWPPVRGRENPPPHYLAV